MFGPYFSVLSCLFPPEAANPSRIVFGETETNFSKGEKPLSPFFGRSGRRRGSSVSSSWSSSLSFSSSYWFFYILLCCGGMFCFKFLSRSFFFSVCFLLPVMFWIRDGWSQTVCAHRRRSTASSKSCLHLKEAESQFAFSTSSKMQTQVGLCCWAVGSCFALGLNRLTRTKNNALIIFYHMHEPLVLSKLLRIGMDQRDRWVGRVDYGLDTDALDSLDCSS